MHNEISSLLGNLEKPLLFSSRNNYSNIYKIKNLPGLVEEISLKILSLNPPPDLKESIESIRKSFRSYENQDYTNKIKAIQDTLKMIKKMKSAPPGNVKVLNPSNQPEAGSTKNLKDNIQYIKGIGPKLAKNFERKEIRTIEDLLFYFPRKYEDRRKIKKISTINPGNRETVTGEVIVSGIVKTGSRTLYNVIINDGTSNLGIIWFRFNQKYLKNTYKKGTRVCINGEITYNRYEKILQIIHPSPEDIEVIDSNDILEESLNFNRVVPIYPLTEGLRQKRLRSILKNVSDNYSALYSGLIPDEIRSSYDLVRLDTAISKVHYPDNNACVVDIGSSGSVYRSKPHRTIAFFEFFIMELAVGLLKNEIRKKRSLPVNSKGNYERMLKDSLPFELTQAQKRVLEEIKDDMRNKHPMNRLLQGDVGSGKTIVALLSMLNIVESGYQAVLMAPTEILAEQHFRSISAYLDGMDIGISILKSGITSKHKQKTNEDIRSGMSRIIVGTHALIEDKVEFDKLGLVIVDEQHRFGVRQRSTLINKGVNPHVLVMTATPIPRTLAISLYGDLDVSVIDQLPEGRKGIKTLLYRNNKTNRQKIYSTVEEELKQGRQAYFVCPMIESSEESDIDGVSFAVELADDLQKNVFSDYEVGILHGRMSSEEKDETMNMFLGNSINVLVSTTVIEVGVDVPNATLMVIENAERFGLSQLHQLRGRIGRGNYVSKCILMCSYRVSGDAAKKLKVMCDTSDGFVIAEEDLKIRGPGDFLGTKQSGMPEFKFADLVRDYRILTESRKAAMDITGRDTNLDNYPELKKYIKSKKNIISGSDHIS